MNAWLVLSVVLASAPPPTAPPGGVVAATPLEEVQQFDAQLPSLLTEGEALDAAFATADELRPLFKKAGVTNAADLDVLVARAANDKLIDDEDLPKPFVPVIALVAPHDKGASHNVRFYDASSYRLDLDVFERAKGRWALSSAPSGQPANVADDLEYLQAAFAEGRIKALPRVFSKEPAGWIEDKMPEPDAAYCRDAMHAKAKRIHATQLAYREKHKKFRGGEKTTSFGDGFMGWSAVEPIDDDHFRAEVGRHGGLVTVDETGVITDVSPCALTKDAVKAQAKAKKKKK